MKNVMKFKKTKGESGYDKVKKSKSNKTILAIQRAAKQKRQGMYA